ncbi:MAG: hypothetical protein AAFV47_09795 [Pseudomonadota bacterium]
MFVGTAVALVCTESIPSDIRVLHTPQQRAPRGCVMTHRQMRHHMYDRKPDSLCLRGNETPILRRKSRASPTRGNRYAAMPQ